MSVVGGLRSWSGRFLVVCAVASIVGAPAQASLAASGEPSGVLGFSPATGTDWTPLSLVSTGICSDPRGSNLQLMISGHGFPGPTNVTPNLRAAIYPVDPSTGGYDVPLQDSLHNFAAQQSPAAVLSGRYDFTLVCKKPWGAGTFGTYRGSLVFSSPTKYRALTVAPAVTAPSAKPVTGASHPAPTPRPTRAPSPTVTRSPSVAPVTSAAHVPHASPVTSVPSTSPAARSPQAVRSSAAVLPAPAATPPAGSTSPASSQAVRPQAPAAAPLSPLAADLPRSQGASRGWLLAVAGGTSAVVVLLLGLVLRRRLGQGRPT